MNPVYCASTSGYHLAASAAPRAVTNSSTAPHARHHSHRCLYKSRFFKYDVHTLILSQTNGLPLTKYCQGVVKRIAGAKAMSGSIGADIAQANTVARHGYGNAPCATALKLEYQPPIHRRFQRPRVARVIRYGMLRTRAGWQSPRLQFKPVSTVNSTQEKKMGASHSSVKTGF